MPAHAVDAAVKSDQEGETRKAKGPSVLIMPDTTRCLSLFTLMFGGYVNCRDALHRACAQPLRALLTFFIVVYAILTGLFGVQALIWGRAVGKKRGDIESNAIFAGGLGGALAGSLFLGTLVVLVALSVIARQSRTDNAISPAVFYAVLLISGIVGLLLGARWQWSARALVGSVGALATCILLAMTLHMTTLLPKIILICTAQVISLILSTLLRIPSLSPRTSTRCLCVLSGFTGAWLLISAIDLWTKCGVLDAISLFVAPDGIYSKTGPIPYQSVVEWSQSKVKGMLAGFWLFGIAFSAFQLWFYTEDAADSWNQFLSQVIATEEDATGRAVNGRRGIFEPRPPLWKRIFGGNTSAKTRAFGQRADWNHKSEKLSTYDDMDWNADLNNNPFDDPRSNEGLYDGPHQSKPPCRYDEMSIDDTRSDFNVPPYSTVRFNSGPRLPSYHSSSHASKASGLSSSVSADESNAQSTRKAAATGRSVSFPMATPALAEYEKQSGIQSGTTLAHQPRPGTVKRAVKSLFGEERPPARFPRSRSVSERSLSMDDNAPNPADTRKDPPIAPVPATPSLIKAIERISAAQREAANWRQRQAIEEVAEDDDENTKDDKDPYADMWSKIEKKSRE